MSLRGLIIMIPVLLIVPMPSQGEEPKTDTDKIQGTWKLVRLEEDGNLNPGEIVNGSELVFKGDALTFVDDKPGGTKFTYKLDPSTKPAGLDITHADGKKKGETLKGIYSLEGDSLKICFGKPDQRPKDFTAKAMSGQWILMLKREKP
jgi:uncharacterized protein (TIGR03067 family)